MRQIHITIELGAIAHQGKSFVNADQTKFANRRIIKGIIAIIFYTG